MERAPRRFGWASPSRGGEVEVKVGAVEVRGEFHSPPSREGLRRRPWRSLSPCRSAPLHDRHLEKGGLADVFRCAAGPPPVASPISRPLGAVTWTREDGRDAPRTRGGPRVRESRWSRVCRAPPPHPPPRSRLLWLSSSILCPCASGMGSAHESASVLRTQLTGGLCSVARSRCADRMLVNYYRSNGRSVGVSSVAPTDEVGERQEE